jgi:hypothetical protein
MRSSETLLRALCFSCWQLSQKAQKPIELSE